MFHVEDSFASNRLPRETAQSFGTSSKTDVEQPTSENTTIDCGEAVDTRTLTSCSGVPTRRKKVLHGPSLPSLRCRVSRRCSVGEEAWV